MKLDSRIIEGKKPLDCFKVSVAKEFIGKECYFSDSLSDFSRLSCFADFPSEHRRVGTLRLVSETDVSPFYLSDLHSCCYILPCEWVKESEKKYRAFTIKEFQQKYSVGSVFQIRQKQNRFTESVVQYTGYKVYEERIYLGITDFTLDELFENFEKLVDGDWKPFGVEE